MPFKDKEKKREYQRKYMRKWYRENKEKHIAYVRKRDKKIKDWLRDYKKTLECEECGEDHPACLDFHHIDSSQKSFSLGRINKFLSKQLIKDEIAKCRVLCSNCHRKKHWNERNGED